MNKILSVVVLCVLVSASAWGQANPPLKVREADGTPSKSGINTLVVSNGSLSISGTTATVTTGVPELSTVGSVLVSSVPLRLPGGEAGNIGAALRFGNDQYYYGFGRTYVGYSDIYKTDYLLGWAKGEELFAMHLNRFIFRPDRQLTWSSDTSFPWNPIGVDIGLIRHAAGVLRLTDANTGSGQLLIGSSTATIAAQAQVISGSASRVGFRVDTASSPSVDIAQFTNNGSDRWTVNSASTATTNTLTAPSGATSIGGVLTENVTLSTAGTTTDSTIDLPANSIILSVSARVTTTIETATDWKLGDSTIDDRFTSANATLTAGTTGVGINQWKADRTTAGQGAYQNTAAKVRITTSGTPTAGAIRITIHYIQLTAPTS